MITFMTTMIQIRSVPPEFHRRLKARAAMEGVSMSEYILREISKSLDVPARAEVLARIRARGPRYLKTSAADDLRAEREEREAHLGALRDRR
jgi:antitoxin FitA